MSRLLGILYARWFAPAPPTRLGWIRVLVGLFVLDMLWRFRRTYLRVGHTDPEHFVPVGIVGVLEAPLEPVIYLAQYHLCLALGVLFTIGLWHRWVGPLFALTLLWVYSYRLSWGMIYRNYHLVALHVVVLGLTASAGAVSVDAWLRRRRGVPATSPERTGWPVRLLCAVTVSAYFVAGIAKLNGAAGWRWALGGNLADHIGYDALYKELIHPEGAGELVTWALAHPEILVPGAILAFAGELLAPLVLLHRRAGQAWAVLMWPMHLGIMVLMTITFPYQCTGLAFASFFAIERPLDGLVQRVRRAWSSASGRRAVRPTTPSEASS